MKNSTLVKIVVGTLMMLMPAVVFARPDRIDQIPNNDFACNICHTENGGMTDFGFDSFEHTNNGVVDWAGLAALDTDKDGYSNGLELGDPDGTWQIGDADPPGPTTDPRDATDNFCGNGTFEGNEECDGTNLNGGTCSSIGLSGDGLACNPTTCQYDTTGCGGGTCGDGVKQQSEDCEGMDLGGATCETLGYDGGILACNSGCNFDTLSCSGSNGSDGPGFSLCGDGLQTGIEDCDTFDTGGETCASLGWEGGNLNCTASCTFSYVECEGPPPTPAEQAQQDENTQPEPADAPATNPGAISQQAAHQVPDNIQMDGRACTVGGAQNAAPSALVLLFIGLLGLGRRRF